MPDRKYYCFCSSNCKFETMTKEQILAAIAEATGKTVTDIDAAFITKIKEQNKGAAVKVWFGTEAEYNAIEEKDPYCIYVKTDDKTIEKIYAKLTSIENDLDGIKNDYRTVDGVVEWINPPLEIGVEYRTTERYNYKPVYIKLIDIGALPNATRKTVDVGVDGGKIFDMHLELHMANGQITPYPYVDGDYSVVTRAFISHDNKLYFDAKIDLSTFTGKVIIKYTK